MYKSTDVIFVLTNKRGFIPQLRIAGPIVSPMRASIAQCLAMLTVNIPLYQYDPTTKRVVELTLNNLTDDQKFSPKAEEVKVAEAPKLPQVEVKVTSKNDTENTAKFSSNKQKKEFYKDSKKEVQTISSNEVGDLASITTKVDSFSATSEAEKELKVDVEDTKEEVK